jgi:hypothetical protein
MQHSTTGMMVPGKAGTRSIRIPSHSAIRSAPHVGLEGVSTESHDISLQSGRRRAVLILPPGLARPGAHRLTGGADPKAARRGERCKARAIRAPDVRRSAIPMHRCVRKASVGDVH